MALLALMVTTLALSVPAPAESKASVSARSTKAPVSRTRSRSARSGRGRHVVTQYLGSRRKQVTVGRHRGRHHRRSHHGSRAPKPRYAYQLDLFMMKAPEFDVSLLPEDLARPIRQSFVSGIADDVPARSMVRAGIAQYYPMRGGIFWRREPVKYIVVHSTETGIPLGAKRVIDSWTSMGRRHPGAQYVVDRDGTIFLAVDPDLATVHVNIFKTLPGINNDNSIGIEMVHTGRQTYPPEQRSAVIRLVSYLQDRYKVSDESVITHRYAQQGDHTDPVHFDWDGFLKDKSHFRAQAIATRMSQMTEDAQRWWNNEWPTASTFLQIHGKMKGIPEFETAGASGEPGAAAAANPAPPLEQMAAKALVSEKEPATNTQVSLPVGKEMQRPALRGPIELDPAAASLLSAPRADAKN